jgi:glycosyltransferase involved in cell wall biosynthesis
LCRGNGVFSVVIPTYNRKQILEKCLRALEGQLLTDGSETGYEIVLVDDGSTDGTLEWLQEHAVEFPHVRSLSQHHQGQLPPEIWGRERVRGYYHFIDSDLVVTEHFLQAHTDGLIQGQLTYGSDRVLPTVV